METYYIEQYRHKNDSVLAYDFATSCSKEAHLKNLEASKQYNMVTVAVFIVKIK